MFHYQKDNFIFACLNTYMHYDVFLFESEKLLGRLHQFSFQILKSFMKLFFAFFKSMQIK